MPRDNDIQRVPLPPPPAAPPPTHARAEVRSRSYIILALGQLELCFLKRFLRGSEALLRSAMFRCARPHSTLMSFGCSRRAHAWRTADNAMVGRGHASQRSPREGARRIHTLQLIQCIMDSLLQLRDSHVVPDRLISQRHAGIRVSTTTFTPHPRTDVDATSVCASRCLPWRPPQLRPLL